MLISRRSALAYASALGASVSASLPAGAMTAPVPTKNVQRVQQLVIHRDEGFGQAIVVSVALRAPDTTWGSVATLTESELRTTMRSYNRRNYSLRRINAFQTRRGMRYAALWQWGTTATEMRHNMSAAEFNDAAVTMANRGYAPIHVDAVATESGPRFAAIWEAASRTDKMFADLTADELQQHTAAPGSDGYRLTSLAGHAQGGATRFAAVFSRTAAQVESDHAVPAIEIYARSAALASRGFALTDANGYVVGGKPFIAAVWSAA